MNKSNLKKAILGVLIPVLLLIFTSFFLLSEKTQKEETRPFLGVGMQSLSSDELKELGLKHGVRVSTVEQGSSADKAGIQKGDIIQFFEGKEIEIPEALSELVQAGKPGDKVKIKLVRSGKPMELTATLGERKLVIVKEKGDKLFYSFGESGYYLGVQLMELSEDLAPYFAVKKEEGVLVVGVDSESPAEKAQIKAGDVITTINGMKVADAEQARKALAELKDGKAEIVLVRHGKPMTVSAQPEKQRNHYFFRSIPGIGRSLDRYLAFPDIDISPGHLDSWDIRIDPDLEGHLRFEMEKLDRAKEHVKLSEEKIKEIQEKLKQEEEKLSQKSEKKLQDVEEKLKQAEKRTQKKIEIVKKKLERNIVTI